MRSKSRWWVLACVLFGCADELPRRMTEPSDSDASRVDSNMTPTDAGSLADTQFDSGPPSAEAGPPFDSSGELASPGVLVRYFLDEAAGDQAITRVHDAVPDPLDLTLVYVGASPRWAVDQNRHLLFSGPIGTATGGALIDARDTKVDVLHGTTAATLEAKYMLQCSSEPRAESRVLTFSNGPSVAEAGWLAMRVLRGVDGLYVRFAQLAQPTFFGFMDPCPATSVRVVHWVIDTARVARTDRIRAFIDGVQVPIEGKMPPRGATVDLGLGKRQLLLGRPSSTVQTLNGRLYYAAVYTKALSPSEVERNAKRLLANDDR